MSMYHHGQLPYEVAHADCGARTREKFNQLLKQGETQLPKAIEHFQTVPDDTIVKGELLDLVIEETNQIKLKTAGLTTDWGVHDNAWQQICGKTGFPKQYAEKLRESDWGRELVSLNLNTIFANQEKRRYLIRSVDGQARGFLSDRYRRLDMRPIMDNIFAEAQEVGAVVIQAKASDVKGEVKFAYPAILEPVKDEPILFWVSARASDFGDSKVEINIGITRAWCTNFATTDSLFSQVHLGKQLPDNIEFSEETYKKDTAFVVSATRDTFKHGFSEKTIALLCEKIKKAAEEPAPKDIGQALRRAGLSKGEQEACETLYAMPDIEVLPKGDTMWRFSNAVSFLAQSTKSVDRQLELEEIAGDLLKAHQKKAQQIAVAA